MAISIKKNGKTIKFTVEAVAKFEDGTSAPVPASVTAAVALSAYNKAVVAPPVVEVPKPPVTELPSSPVIISPGSSKEISWDDFCVLRDVENQNFTIKPGSYTREANPGNLKNVKIEGANKINLTTGYRGITLSNKIIGLVLSGFNLTNIPNYQIFAEASNQNKYTGKEGSFIDGLILQNFIVNGGGTLFQMEGNINNGVYDGVIKNFKLLNSTLRNMLYPGSVVYLGNGIDYEIAGNILDKINTVFAPATPNGIHNGIFLLKGNGKLHDNRITNHQGNVGRFWLHSIDGAKTVEAYNNFIYNAWKYSAFELQNPQYMIDLGAKPANAKIYNNIAGQLSVSKDWDGQMLDLYNFNGGSLEYTGNKGFDMVKTLNQKLVPVVTGDLMINNMSDVMVKASGNIYYPTKAEAIKANSSLSTLLS